MDHAAGSPDSCSAATTLYEVSFSSVTNRIVCDRTSDLCGKAICQCDERRVHHHRDRFLSFVRL